VWVLIVVVVGLTTPMKSEAYVYQSRFLNEAACQEVLLVEAPKLEESSKEFPGLALLHKCHKLP
jgi:hypothetical protein